MHARRRQYRLFLLHDITQAYMHINTWMRLSKSSLNLLAKFWASSDFDNNKRGLFLFILFHLRKIVEKAQKMIMYRSSSNVGEILLIDIVFDGDCDYVNHL